MYKKLFLLIIVFILLVSFAYSEESIVSLYIDDIQLNIDLPVIKIDDQIMIPMAETFSHLGAHIHYGDILTSYYLNTFVKVDTNLEISINGNIIKNKAPAFYRDEQLYIPIEVLTRAFDFTIREEKDQSIYLEANSIIQYKHYENIHYKEISFEKEAIRLAVPMFWKEVNDYSYGYDSSYGETTVELSTRSLNDNIDIDYIMDTYKEHLMMAYEEQVLLNQEEQKIYNYLTSNVLYIDLDVNGSIRKRVVHFIESDDLIYIIEFNYPNELSEPYMLATFNNIMNAFYIDHSSFDSNKEHYIEFLPAREYQMNITNSLYSNMTVEDEFYIEGYFNTDKIVEALLVSVSREDNTLEFYIPVENNAFYARIYTPFGLGKHDIKIAISAEEEKVIFDPSNPIEFQTDDISLLQLSVVNLSKENNRYVIPTKYVESNHSQIISMSNLLTRKYQTYYSKAKAIYDFIVKEVEVLSKNEINYTAIDVYENFRGTEKEIAFYLTALLRAQNIPSKIIEGENEYSSHIWVEAYLNGTWLILDSIGDNNYYEDITTEISDILPASFNPDSRIYKARYNSLKNLDY